MAQREQVKISLTQEAVQRMDSLRGDLRRSEWVERLIANAIGTNASRANSGKTSPSSASSKAIEETELIHVGPETASNATEISSPEEINQTWVDINDYKSLQNGIAIWRKADRTKPPPILVYDGTHGWRPESAPPEQIEKIMKMSLKDMWAWVDQNLKEAL